MAPNKKKSPDRTATGFKGLKASEINTEVLCDEKWKCTVCLLHEGDTDGLNLINALQQIPAKQISGCVKVISKSDLLKDAKKSGGKVKKSTGKSQPEEKELTDEQKIAMYIKENVVIPGKPLAGVIKKQLINMKVEDIKERKKLLSTFEDYQKKKAKLESKGSKRGNKDEKSVTGDTVKPEDVFIEKPPIFVILLGFNEVDLPFELVKQEIPICAVVKLISYAETEPKESSHSLTDLGSDKFNMPWLAFWRKFDHKLNSHEYSEIGNNLATIIYKVPREFNSISIKEKKNFSINQFTEIMNHVLNLKEMYKLYCDNLFTCNITAEIRTEKADLYNTLIQMVPLECTSIPLILFTLIEQVCHWNGEEIEIDINSEGKSYNSEYTDIGNSINLSLRHKSQLLSKKNIKYHPIIIRNNDEQFIRTFHLDIPEIDLNKVGVQFLSKSFLLNHWLQNNMDHMQRYFLEFHLQRLWRLAYKEISLNLFYIYLHLYIFGKMKSYYTYNLKNSKISNGVSTDDHIEVSSDISGRHNLLLEWLNEIKLTDKNKVSDKKADFSGVDDQQSTNKTTDTTVDGNCDKDTVNINEKSEEAECSKEVNTNDKYVTISLNDIPGLSEQKTAHSIKTKRNHSLSVLSKFLNCPEILCLYENYESPIAATSFKSFTSYKFIEEMKPAPLLQSLHESIFNYSQIHSVYYYPSNKVLLWFHNSSDTVFVDHKTGELETALGFRDFCDNFFKTEDSLPKQKDSTMDKGSANINDQEAHHGIHDTDSLKDDRKESVLNRKKKVYDLGKKKIQFEESTQWFSSKDGSNIIVKTEDSYRSSQFVKVFIKKIDTEMNIYINKFALFLDDDCLVDNEPVETMKLSLNLPNDIILNVKVDEKINSTEMDCGSETLFSYRDLTITLPNGLIVQVLKNRFDNNNIYIKQSFTTKGLTCNKIWDEKCRCFDRFGTIVIFKNDDTIDVIYNNTAVGTIVEIEKSVSEIVDESAPKIIAEKSPGKVATNKGKKNKTKQTEPILEESSIEEEVQVLPYTVTEHFIKSWSGISYHYRGDICADIIDNNVNLRTIFLPYKQLYIDRNDGTKSLYADDGKLTSTYRDGTMVTSCVYEEPDYIDIMSLLPSEFEEQESEDQSDSVRVSGHFNVNFGGHERSILNTEEESYVSFKMGYTAEHPNYCTVKFSPINDSISLIFPGNLLVSIHNIQSGMNGFTVNVNNKSVSEFTKHVIYFKSNIIKKYKKNNVTTISPILQTNTNSIDDGVFFCKTIDSLGRIFLVDKFGQVKLNVPDTESKRKSTDYVINDTVYYYENNIPKQMKERFFVVDDNFSGYEVLDQTDIQLLDKEDENRYNNVDTVKNPTKNRIFSKTNQYRIYKSYSDGFLMQPIIDFLNVVPSNFQRADLGPTWTTMQSPWLFIRPDGYKSGYRQFSFTRIPKHTDDRIIAVVIKTIQKVSDSNNLNGLDIILSCLEKYKNENEKISTKYKQQGFTDYEIDPRLKENQILISSIKKEFPLWNMLRTNCNTCNQSFGSPAKAVSEMFIPGPKNMNSGVEQIIDEIHY